MQRLFNSFFRGSATPTDNSNAITNFDNDNQSFSINNINGNDNIHETLHKLLLSTLSTLNKHHPNLINTNNTPINSTSTAITEENNTLTNSLQAQSIFNNLSMRMHSLSALSTLIASQRIKQLSNTVDGHNKSIDELREENIQLNKVVNSLTNALQRATVKIEELLGQVRRSDNLFVNGGLLIGSVVLHKLLFIHDIIGILLGVLIQLISTFTNKRLKSGKRIQALLDVVAILGMYEFTKRRLVRIKS